MKSILKKRNRLASIRLEIYKNVNPYLRLMLCNYLNLNSSTVTGIIDRLEKKGLVARLPKKEDKRTTYIALTSLGAKLLEKIPALLHERLSVKLEKLPKEKINELDEALNVLIHYLDISDVEASPMITIEDSLS